jgi:hypothetical protein
VNEHDRVAELVDEGQDVVHPQQDEGLDRDRVPAELEPVALDGREERDESNQGDECGDDRNRGTEEVPKQSAVHPLHEPVRSRPVDRQCLHELPRLRSSARDGIGRLPDHLADVHEPIGEEVPVAELAHQVRDTVELHVAGLLETLDDDLPHRPRPVHER